MNDGLDSPPPSPSAIPLSSDVVLPSSACQLSLPPSPPFTPPPGLARMRATNSRPSPSPAWHAPSRPFSTATSLRPPLTLSLGAASQKTLATPAKKPQTFPSRPRISPRAALLQPGSARSNYFNLDFSFLDEAPPPGPSPTHHSYTPPSLRSSLNSSKWTSASDDSPDDSDSFDEDVSIPRTFKKVPVVGHSDVVLNYFMLQRFQVALYLRNLPFPHHPVAPKATV